MNEISKPKDPIMGAYEEWKVSRNDETSNKLLAALDGQIGTALHTFAGGMEDHLKLRAQTMALKAAETYDPKKGMHLKSYVYQQLQPLQREYGKRVNAVKLPERQLLDRRTLDRAELEFEEANGRPPSAAELADYTSISIKRIADIRANKTQVAESRTLDDHYARGAVHALTHSYVEGVVLSIVRASAAAAKEETPAIEDILRFSRVGAAAKMAINEQIRIISELGYPFQDPHEKEGDHRVEEDEST